MDAANGTVTTGSPSGRRSADEQAAPPNQRQASGGGVGRLLIPALLLIAVAATFAPVVDFEFVDLDDDEYILENPPVMGGLTLSGVRWAFTQSHAGNWHPVTWLSHMLDCELYGASAGLHHLTNVLIHAINALLLYLLFRWATAATWPSAFVAAAFALHPLHVESVAWVAQRKDVLSTMFVLLTMLAYVGYVRSGATVASPVRARWGRCLAWYGCSVGCYGLAVMAKPMVVTLPLLLMLLDIWPLTRVGPGRRFWLLLLEKTPFALLAAACAGITFFAQQGAGAMGHAAGIPWIWRAANAFMSYASYVVHTIWPRDLSVLYMHPNLAGGEPWAMWQGVAAVLLLVCVTFALMKARGRFALVGWLWFLIALLPAIGLVQVGRQAMADRYMYLPIVGLFVIAAWGAERWFGRLRAAWPVIGRIAAVASCAVIVMWSSSSVRQLRRWRNSRTLYAQALTVESRNPIIHYNLAKLHNDRGRPDAAMVHYLAAIKADSRFVDAHNNLANLLLARGHVAAAIGHYIAALGAQPDHALSHNNLGWAYVKIGRADKAAAHFDRAVELRPGWPAPQVGQNRVRDAARERRRRALGQ